MVARLNRRDPGRRMSPAIPYRPGPPITASMLFWGDVTSPRTSIVSGGVDVLGDASGNRQDFVAATAGKRPVYNALDATFGRPSFTTDGISKCLGRAAGLPASANMTIYMVTRGMVQAAGGQRLLDVSPLGVAGGVGIYNFPSSMNCEVRFDSNAVPLISSRTFTPLTLTNPNILTAVGALSAGGALWTTYLNGVAGGTTTNALAGAGVSSGTGASAIAAISGGASSFCAATTTDILIYGAVHSAAQVAVMYAWLRARNNL